MCSCCEKARLPPQPFDLRLCERCHLLVYVSPILVVNPSWLCESEFPEKELMTDSRIGMPNRCACARHPQVGKDEMNRLVMNWLVTEVR